MGVSIHEVRVQIFANGIEIIKTILIRVQTDKNVKFQALDKFDNEH